MKKTTIVFVLLLAIVFLAACTGDTVPPAIQKLEITNVTLADKTVTYDGNEYSIKVVGAVPTGVTVSYENNEKSAVGVYQIKATLTGEGYITKVLNASLTILNRVLAGINFSDKTVDYDGNMHKLEITGQLPAGVTVKYQSDILAVTNESSTEGIYNITATLSGVGYETLVLKAKLTIRPVGAEVFTGITFVNKTVVFDGNLKVIEVMGALPAGTTVTYSSTTQGIKNTASDVGVYNVTATITKEGYQTLTLQAVLTISSGEKLQFTGLSFENETIEYDSFEHEMLVKGVLPEGANVSYVSNVNGVTNKASEVGVYDITVTLSKSGYETKALSATLKIKGVDTERFIFVDGSDIYFSNGLDNDRLYVYNSLGVVKINNDEAKHILSHVGQMYYVANGLLSTSIKSFNGTTAQTVFSANAETIAEYLGIKSRTVRDRVNEFADKYSTHKGIITRHEKTGGKENDN